MIISALPSSPVWGSNERGDKDILYKHIGLLFWENISDFL